MMLEMKTTEFLEKLSSKEPVPGGGGASAAVGAFAASLGMMVSNLTIGKKKYADVEEEILKIRRELQSLRDRLITLTDRDAEAFEPLSRAYGLPKTTREEQEKREMIMETALYEASVVPLEIMETVLACVEYLEVLGEKGSRLALSDVGVGILFAQAALEGASLNVFINTKLMKDRTKAEEMNSRAREMIHTGSRKKEQIYGNVLKELQ